MSPAGSGTHAFRPSRLLTRLREADWGNIGANIGAAMIALLVFGTPVYAILNGTGLLAAIG